MAIRSTDPRGTARQLAACGAGLLAGAAAMTTSEAAARALTGVTSPLLAVANRAVDHSPRPVKEWAIATFGTADKQVLIGGVIATVALLAALIGLLGRRRLRLAVGAFLLLSAVAGAAAATDRAASAPLPSRLLPGLALTVVGLAALVPMLRALRRSADRPRVAGDDLPPGFDRRAFLRAALATGAVAGAGGVLPRAYGGTAAAISRRRLTLPTPDRAAPAVPPGAALAVPGLTPYLTSNHEFYRVDTALRVPDVPVDRWRLRVHGMVERELELSHADLLRRRLVERRITLTCVSNPVGGDYAGNATWIGVPIADLLAEAGVRSGADAVKSTSADDFTVGTPLEALTDRDRHALVAVGMNGVPLPLQHGFPARMVTPGLYGYVSATKWLVDLEVTRFADFSAYWTERGYAAQAPIKTASRIDVPRSFARVPVGRTTVAGVAWAQHTGIGRVEVRVDGGGWHEAELAAEDTLDTWRQWVWSWDAAAGNHTLEVRATDHDGHTQTSARAPIAPDGATGWHRVNVTVG